MSNSNFDTRKQMFEIIDKLRKWHNFKLSPKNFSTDNEMIKLIDILTNKNPYKAMQPVHINYDDNLNKDTSAVYYTGQDTISYSLRFVQGVSQHKNNFINLLDTIYHEQRHHFQDHFRTNPELIHNIDFKQATDELLDGQMTDDEIKELNNFANQHNLVGKMISKHKLKKLQFGSYLSKKCEIDARNMAYADTCITFDMMIEDDLCSPAIKRFLTRQFKLYKLNYYMEKADFEKDMQSFKHFDNKVRAILLNAVKTDSKIDNDTYDALLNGILNYITRSSTLKENLEVAGWALKNNYTHLLNSINLRNSLSSERQDLSTFINDILTKNLLTTENFTSICHLFSSFNKKTNDDAITYLVENLADRGCADILLYHANTGVGGASFYSQHISNKMLDVALSNYLSKIEHTKTITNYQQYMQVKYYIYTIQDGNLSSENIKQLALSYIERFNKIDSDKTIKIIKNLEYEKEETLSL